MSEKRTNNNQVLKDSEQRIQELEELLKNYSLDTSQERLTQEEYEDLLYEYETLTHKTYSKPREKNFWDEVNIFIILYGLITITLCLPWLIYDQLGFYLLGVFSKWFAAAVYRNKFVIYLSFYIVPIFLLLISWLIFANLKKKSNRVAFLVIWILQVVLLIAGGIITYVDVLKDIILI